MRRACRLSWFLLIGLNLLCTGAVSGQGHTDVLDPAADESSPSPLRSTSESNQVLEEKAPEFISHDEMLWQTNVPDAINETEDEYTLSESAIDLQLFAAIPHGGDDENSEDLDFGLGVDDDNAAQDERKYDASVTSVDGAPNCQEYSAPTGLGIKLCESTEEPMSQFLGGMSYTWNKGTVTNTSPSKKRACGLAFEVDGMDISNEALEISPSTLPLAGISTMELGASESLDYAFLLPRTSQGEAAVVTLGASLHACEVTSTSTGDETDPEEVTAAAPTATVVAATATTASAASAINVGTAAPSSITTTDSNPSIKPVVVSSTIQMQQQEASKPAATPRPTMSPGKVLDEVLKVEVKVEEPQPDVSSLSSGSQRVAASWHVSVAMALFGLMIWI